MDTSADNSCSSSVEYIETNRRSSRVTNKKPAYSQKKTPKTKLYDAQGRKTTDGTDFCDCGDKECPGCYFPCPNLKCLSNKCGQVCRQNRNWEFDSNRAIRECLPWEKKPLPKFVGLDK